MLEPNVLARALKALDLSTEHTFAEPSADEIEAAEQIGIAVDDMRSIMRASYIVHQVALELMAPESSEVDRREIAMASMACGHSQKFLEHWAMGEFDGE